MLDLSHLMTQHVFRASGLMDHLMIRGQKMSVSPSSVRVELLAECLPLFAEMRELARRQFGAEAAFILAAVDEYEAALRVLARLVGGQITEDRRDGDGDCAACGTAITKIFRGPDWIPVCETCDKPFMKKLAEQSWGPITEDRRDGESQCGECGTAFTKFGPLPDCTGVADHWIILCGECDKPFMEAHGKLSSSKGFGTWAI